MHKISSRCMRAAAVASLAFAASASQAQVYGLVHGGISHIDLSCANQTPCDRSGVALSGQVGFRLSDSWAAELGLLITAGQHGPSNSSINGMDSRSLRVGVAHHHALSRDWMFITRAGLANTKSSAESGLLAEGKQSRSSWVAYAGLGVGLRLSKVVSLQLQADFSSSEAGFAISDNGPVFDGRGSQRALTFGVGFNL